MIPVTAEFHRAVAEGRPQRALLRFANGAVFTNEDISITAGGIHYDQVLNGETELTIGACPSSSIKVSLINENGRLADFKFGQFSASLGVLTGSSKYAQEGNALVLDHAGNRISAHSTLPYLSVNGKAMVNQPSFPVKSLVLDGEKLYCIGDDGRTEVGSWNGTSPGGFELFSPLAVTAGKLTSLARDRRGIVCYGDTITEYVNGQCNVWEYAKLGTFIAPRPAVLRTRIVDMEATDRMTSLDVLMRDISASKFPMTIGELLNTFCELLGLNCVTKEFINRDVIIPTKPEKITDATAREVLGWIAQAACAYARFDREDRLELAWFSESDTLLDESNYSEFTPCEYEVSSIDKLRIRNSDSSVEAVSGNGNNSYMIQDNPLLRQDNSVLTRRATDTNSASSSAPIYERLNSFRPFKPSEVKTFYDWTIQSGDVVQIASGGKVHRMPVYSLSLDWKGSPVLTLENTGSETLPPISEQDRINFGLGGGVHQARREIEDVRTWAQIQVDEERALIALLTGRMSGVEGDLSTAEVRINGVESSIRSQADIIAAQAKILEAKADLILLDAYVKATALETEVLKVLEGATISSVKTGSFNCSGIGTISTLYATGGVIGSLVVGGINVAETLADLDSRLRTLEG